LYQLGVRRGTDDASGTKPAERKTTGLQ